MKSSRLPDRRKNKLRRKAFQLKGFILPFLLVTSLTVGSYLLVVRTNFFRINSVEVHGAGVFVSGIDVDEITRSRVLGDLIFSFKGDELEELLEDNFQGAKEINLKKKYPKTLVVEIVEREPIAVVYNNRVEEYFLVDSDGYVLGVVNPDNTNFPKVFYEGDIAVGYFLDKYTVSAYFELISALDTENLQASSISVHPEYVEAYVKNVQVFISGSKDKLLSVKVLDDLLNQLASEGKNPKKVDLRYDKVIVSYN